MSTDTNYVVTVRAKNSGLRQAAADLIELASIAWYPEREDKKTMIRIKIFRNESNSRGCLEPPSLCEDAARLFPGVDIDYESENEHGDGGADQWYADGMPPDDIPTAVAAHVLSRVTKDVKQLHERVEWLAPLEKWSKKNSVDSAVQKKISKACRDSEVAATKKR